MPPVLPPKTPHLAAPACSFVTMASSSTSTWMPSTATTLDLPSGLVHLSKAMEGGASGVSATSVTWDPGRSSSPFFTALPVRGSFISTAAMPAAV